MKTKDEPSQGVEDSKKQKIRGSVSSQQETGGFLQRHLGPTFAQQQQMLSYLSKSSLNDLISAALPATIQAKLIGNVNVLEAGHGELFDKGFPLRDSLSETEMTKTLTEIMSQNQLYKSYLGQGYYDCVIPSVIRRNVFENPGWYTAYTPYQAEIAQGRLEALLNYQQMISDLTGLPVANASLLDEGTACAEAMAMAFAVANAKGSASRNQFLVSSRVFAQTIGVLKTRAKPLGIEVVVGDVFSIELGRSVFGVLVQYPDETGNISDFAGLREKIHDVQALWIMACDLLALTLIKSPGEWGVDIAVGSSQRFGVPLGFGGPHAAFIATQDEYKRLVPGRFVGVSMDSQKKVAYRLALQTREQHIRRERATSNICTSQVLLAVMASMYAVYHGPKGLRNIASRIHVYALSLATHLEHLGYQVLNPFFFDTLQIHGESSLIQKIYKCALERRINLRLVNQKTLGISLDETTTEGDLEDLYKVFVDAQGQLNSVVSGLSDIESISGARHNWPSWVYRKTNYLTHSIFNSYHSETEMLRYIFRLQRKDITLADSMIPLGSCTMKLNSATEMYPVSWPIISQLHPYVPQDQAKGYHFMIQQLQDWICYFTGFSAVSVQPNAGSQGEYAGLLVIRKYHELRGEGFRNICLIPTSAHGTNPASAVMAGLQVVPVLCDTQGNVDLNDLKTKAKQYCQRLAALMVTYPSTHGVFEAGICKIAEIVHENGGQVYMDGANFNALVGLCRPAELGIDVAHLNLHKTFCIPHGGGGPGVGPIGVRQHLADFLPCDPLSQFEQSSQSMGPVTSARFGSASILPISWAYMAMMGEEGLRIATQVAILNANYIAKKLDPYYPILYKGQNDYVAHECIIDVRSLKTSAGIEAEDIAKRLMDFGFHAPTMSWPVPGTLMIEPTESESLSELDRFCEAMIHIRKEIADIENGHLDRRDNPLKNAPHTAEQVSADEWPHSYSRQMAAYPLSWVRISKYWPPVGRVDNVYGDRNFFCSCP